MLLFQVLHTLNLRITRVSDVSCLAVLPHLHSLDISWTPVMNVTALAAGCPELHTLDLEHTQVRGVCCTPLGCSLCGGVHSRMPLCL